MPKLSELPDATTPLDGDEYLVVVQGGTTKKVAASDVGSPGGGDLPTPGAGDAGLAVVVNGTEDGYELTSIAGGTVPTGTGFTHITAGAQDAAAKLVVDADVDAAAAIALSKTALSANAQTWLTTPSSANLRTLVSDETGTGALYFAGGDFGAATGTSAALSSFVSVGGTVASAGSVRLSSTGSIQADNGSGTNYKLVELAGNLINIGQSTGVTGIVLNASTSHSFAIGGTTQAIVDSTGLKLGSSFRILLNVPAIISDRTLSFPLLTGNDTMVTEAFTQTLTNKTIAAGSNTITGIADANIDAAANIALSKTALSANARTFLATPSSANLATLVSDETGSAGNLVFSTNPSLTGPTITTSVTLSGSGLTTTGSGNAKGTSYDKCPVNVQTTDATVTTLDSFTLASNTAVCVTWMVTATKSDLSAAAGYSVSAVFKNNAGTVAQVGTTTTTVIGESNSSWDATADNSTTTIRLRVTGVAATTIQWTSIMTRLDVIP